MKKKYKLIILNIKKDLIIFECGFILRNYLTLLFEKLCQFMNFNFQGVFLMQKLNIQQRIIWLANFKKQPEFGVKNIAALIVIKVVEVFITLTRPGLVLGLWPDFEAL